MLACKIKLTEREAALIGSIRVFKLSEGSAKAPAHEWAGLIRYTQAFFAEQGAASALVRVTTFKLKGLFEALRVGSKQRP
jgi:hypothetical protein